MWRCTIKALYSAERGLKTREHKGFLLKVQRGCDAWSPLVLKGTVGGFATEQANESGKVYGETTGQSWRDALRDCDNTHT